MIDMPGNFAVVIHGEYDCVNCFHHHVGRSAWRYYSTRLTEQMLTTGRTEEALRTCLELIAAEERPDAVIVLGTCPVEVIGDQFGPVVKDVSERTGIPMVPLRTSGLALSSQQQMLDWLFVTLAELPPGPLVDRHWQREVALSTMALLFEGHAGGSSSAAALDRLRQLPPPTAGGGVRINLLGLPATHGQLPEPFVLLPPAGVQVAGAFPDGASLDEWRGIRHATHTVVADRTMYPRLLERLEAGFGQQVIEVPLPIGLGPSRRVYAAIGQAAGVVEAVDEVLAPWVARAEAALASARQALTGKRVAVTIRMLANYQVDNLAYDGLGEVEALQEMGLDVEIFVQGAPEHLGAYREELAERGLRQRIHVFGGPWILADRLREVGVDLVVASDTVRSEAQAAGIAMLRTRSLGAWLGAVPDNVEKVRGALMGVRGAA